MKKTLTFILFIALFSNASAQILNRSENWPNISWTLGGTYTPAALIFNPTVDNKFKFDAAYVSPPGSATTAYAASPSFDLKPAFDGGQKGLNISFDISYAASAELVLTVQYWNADTSAWVIMPDGMAPIGSQGVLSTCANDPVNLYFDFTTFTTNQLQNFRYRFYVNDAGNQFTGVCVSSPVITSLSCPAPTGLIVSNINTTDVTLGWTGVGSSFVIQYGLQGFSLGSGTQQDVNISTYFLNGLSASTNYDFYVKEDCSNSNIVVSAWAGPQSFTTTSLGLEERKLQGFKLYPNPTKNIISMDSEKVLNEIKVFNLSGKELMKLKPKKAQTNVDLSALSSGFYFIKVTTESGSGTYKVLKN